MAPGTSGPLARVATGLGYRRTHGLSVLFRNRDLTSPTGVIVSLAVSDTTQDVFGQDLPLQAVGKQELGSPYPIPYVLGRTSFARSVLYGVYWIGNYKKRQIGSCYVWNAYECWTWHMPGRWGPTVSTKVAYLGCGRSKPNLGSRF